MATKDSSRDAKEDNKFVVALTEMASGASRPEAQLEDLLSSGDTHSASHGERPKNAITQADVTALGLAARAWTRLVDAFAAAGARLAQTHVLGADATLGDALTAARQGFGELEAAAVGGATRAVRGVADAARSVAATPKGLRALGDIGPEGGQQ